MSHNAKGSSVRPFLRRTRARVTAEPAEEGFLVAKRKGDELRLAGFLRARPANRLASLVK